MRLSRGERHVILSKAKDKGNAQNVILSEAKNLAATIHPQ